jgi:drug/metabolite transporter (DMT)-like permease
MRRRIRYGEKWAGLSALALVGFLFLDWFGVTGGPGQKPGWTAYAHVLDGSTGWDTLGWLALALCLIAMLLGLAVPLAYARSESPALPELTAVLCCFAGILAVIALLVQVIFQPGPDELVRVESGWWLGLLAALGIARGGYLSMHDEFITDVPLPDVEVRPAPVA